MAIKSTLVTPPNKAKEIDWDTKQILQSSNTSDNTILIYFGIHSNNKFSGTVLSSDYFSVGRHDDDWEKSLFTQITTPITITFENE